MDAAHTPRHSLARRILLARRASAAAELAIILPVMMILVAGIVEFGQFFAVYDATNRIASQFAIAWADCSDVPTTTCQTELSSYTTAFAWANVAPQLQASQLTLNMFEITMSGTTPSVVYAYSSGSANPAMTAAQTSAAQATIPSGQTGVIVTATYAHTLQFFNFLMSPFLGPYLNVSYTVAQLKT